MKRATQRMTVLFAVAAAMLMVATLISCEDDQSGCEETDPTLVTSQDGDLRGVEVGDMVAFRGIPYAAPPEGDLRWKAPQDPASWDGERAAGEFGNVCPQGPSPFGSPNETTEDCLYLNVFTPDISGSYPVMVWIHGGAFIYGSGQEPGYDPTRLVKEGIVVVTLNYRLGALGFMPHPALTDESPDHESGNYGFMDQQKALQYVQDNIAAFGGNPDNVTIFGESAGGHSVYTHMVAPGSEKLFHKAISESGAYFPTQPSFEEAYVISAAPFAYKAAEIAGIDISIGNPDYAAVRESMRDMTIQQVLASQIDISYVPVTGGGVLPKSIYDAVTAQEFARVPVISGSNLNEGRLFTALGILEDPNYLTECKEPCDDDSCGTSCGEGALVATLDEFFAMVPGEIDSGAVAEEYMSKQDPADPNRYRYAYSQVWTDFMFATTNFDIWGKLAQSTNVYAYWFKDKYAPNDLSQLLPMEATHTDEIQYVFGVVGANGGTDEQVALSEEMVGYWTRFAKTGKPASFGWSAYIKGTLFGGGLSDLAGVDQSDLDGASQSEMQELLRLFVQLGSTVKVLDTPTSNTWAYKYMNEYNCLYWAEILMAE